VHQLDFNKEIFTLTRGLELKFKGWNLWDNSEHDGSARYWRWKTSKGQRCWQEIENDSGRISHPPTCE